MSLTNRNCAVVGLLLIFIASPIIGSEGDRYTVTMPDGPSLSFTQPTAWSVETGEEGPAVTVRLSSANGGDFVMLMTIFPFQPDSPVASPEGLRSAVLEVGEQKLPLALQNSIELIEVRGSGVLGYLYHLTDRNPERGPGDYREANQGMMLFDPYIASVTVLTHSEDTSTVERALEVLKSIQVESKP